FQSPGAPLGRIVDPGLHQTFQRAKIFFQIEDAIAQLEIKTRAVELAAMFQTSKRLLRHARIEYLSLEVVYLLRLRTRDCPCGGSANHGTAGKQRSVAKRSHRRRASIPCC